MDEKEKLAEIEPVNEDESISEEEIKDTAVDVTDEAGPTEENAAVIPPEELVDDDEDDFDEIKEPEPDSSETESEESEDITEAADEEQTEEIEKPKKKLNIPWKRLGIGAGILAGVCALIYFGGVWYYSSHFYPGTNLGSFHCANLTVEQAEEKIRKEMDEYTYTIRERGDKKEYIHGKDIDLKCEEINGVAEAKKNQNPFGWITDKAARNQEIEVLVSYDEDKLYHIAEGLECTAESIAGMDGATAGVYYENGAYHMKEAEGKNIISFSRFYTALRAGIYGAYKDMSLEDEGLYVLMAEEDKLKQALADLNKYVSASITYTKGAQSFVVNADTISQWLTLNPDYTVTLNN